MYTPETTPTNVVTSKLPTPLNRLMIDVQEQ